MSALSQAEIIDLLRQQVQGGCTDVLAEAPVNHYEAAPQATAFEAAPQAAISPAPAPISTPPSSGETEPRLAKPMTPAAAQPSSEAGIETAAALAAKADSLPALRDALHEFDGCALKATAKNLVFSDGVADAKIMLIGEAPGQDEDRQGKPFVGRSGQLLDTMLAAIGLSRQENLYIANVVPWRPPGNRTPSSDEIALCKPFITRHIELVKPDYLLLVGNISNKTLLDTTTGITKLRGQWQDYDDDGRAVKALPLLHPAYVLRRPETKADVWADLCRLKQALINA